MTEHCPKCGQEVFQPVPDLVVTDNGASRGERAVRLTRTEAGILKKLADAAGSAVTMEDLGHRSSLKVHFSHMRSALNALHVKVINHRGIGYRLEAESEGESNGS